MVKYYFGVWKVTENKCIKNIEGNNIIWGNSMQNSESSFLCGIDLEERTIGRIFCVSCITYFPACIKKSRFDGKSFKII